jgi:hypothetical protein
MKKWVLLTLGLLLGLSLVGLVVWHLLPPRPGVTPENFHRLRVGMREQEVEAILGEHGEIPAERVIVTGSDLPYERYRYWGGKHSHVEVRFNSGRVCQGRLWDTDDGRQESLPNRDPSFWDRGRGWLPW